METHLESAVYQAQVPGTERSKRWRRVTFLAAASALVGGLAAAWWYKNTLSKLRQAEEYEGNPHFGTERDDSADEI